MDNMKTYYEYEARLIEKLVYRRKKLKIKQDAIMLATGFHKRTLTNIEGLRTRVSDLAFFQERVNSTNKERVAAAREALNKRKPLNFKEIYLYSRAINFNLLWEMGLLQPDLRIMAECEEFNELLRRTINRKLDDMKFTEDECCQAMQISKDDFYGFLDNNENLTIEVIDAFLASDFGKTYISASDFVRIIARRSKRLNHFKQTGEDSDDNLADALEEE